MTQTATTIAERLAAHRFVLQGTGDNCTAYVRSDGQIEEMITLRDEPEAPEHLTDIVAVGTVEVEHSAEGDDHPVIGFTLAEVLAALDHPSDEYALLSLRLDNGLGAGGKRTETDTEALERIAGSAEFGVADESDASVLRAIAERLKASAEPPKVDTPRLSDAQRLGQFLEKYERSHDIDEDDDERFLAFLRSLGVVQIGVSANDEAKTVTVLWVDRIEKGKKVRVDVSDFPQFVG